MTRLLRLSRAALYSAIFLSVCWAIYLANPGWEWLQLGEEKLKALIVLYYGSNINTVKTIEDLKAIIAGLQAILGSLGVIGARYSRGVDKRLNGRWYWTAAMDDMRPTMGEMKFKKIHKDKFRLNNPEQAINGCSFEIDAVGNEKKVFPFSATEIVGGSRAGRTLYFEWETQSGSDTTAGVTRLTFMPRDGRGFFGKTELSISGKFLLNATTGSGALTLHRSKDEAKATFLELLAQFPAKAFPRSITV